MKRTWNYPVLAICFAVVIAVWAFGGIFTTSGVKSDWFVSVKPDLMPPAWVFAPVWTLLYILIAFAMYFAWDNASTRKQKRAAVLIFGLNLAFNALWSLFFFGLQNPAAAFIDIVLLEITTIWAMILSARLDKKTLWLLLPYLLWVAFAAILNWMSV